MRSFEERRWSSADGLSLFARDYAAAGGPSRLPVICLHGLTRNSRDFEDVAPWIAEQGRRVLALDVRGRGFSDRDRNPANYVPTTYVRDVLGLLKCLGIARAVFLGTSMGGIMTMIMAGRHSRVVAAAILNDVGPEVGAEGITRIMSYVGQPVPIESWDDASSYVERINGVAFPDYGREDWDRFARRTFREQDGKPQLDYDPAIMIPLAQGRYKAPTWLAWHLYRKLARRPTLLVRGENSDLLTAEIAQRMKAKASGLETVEVPGVGHAPMLTEAVAQEAIRNFLNRVD